MIFFYYGMVYYNFWFDVLFFYNYVNNYSNDEFGIFYIVVCNDLYKIKIK